MIIKLLASKEINLEYSKITQFFQWMLNRLILGHIRYGPINKNENYLTKLKLELKAYLKSGNVEHLINVANYAFLEMQAPENSKATWEKWDKTVDSVTRRHI